MAKIIDENTISVFVSLEIKKRGGGSTMIIMPNGIECLEDQEEECNYDCSMIKAFANAYKWKQMFIKGYSMGDIAKKEGVNEKYVSRVYRLNLVAPKIIEAIVNGKQPKTLCLEDFMKKQMPDLWLEQYEVYGFEANKVC